MSVPFKIITFILTLLTGMYLAHVLTHTSPYQPQPLDTQKYCVLTDSACLQSGAQIYLNKPHVSALTPVTLTVNWTSINTDTLDLALQGVEMDMGIVKGQLQRNAKGEYTTQIIMPSCSSGAMTWAGTITHHQQTLYVALKVGK